MKSLALLIAICATAVRAADAVDVPARDDVIPLLVVGTNSYTNVRILRTTASDALVKIRAGIIRVRLSDLPADLQKKYPPTAAPAKPTNHIVRSQVQPQISIDMLIRNIETRITALERAKAQLPSQNRSDGTTLVSEHPEVTRRRMQIERALSQLHFQLDRFKAVKERSAARASTLADAADTPSNDAAGAPSSATDSTQSASSESSATVEPQPQTQSGPQAPD